jgi:hypothetical protein
MRVDWGGVSPAYKEALLSRFVDFDRFSAGLRGDVGAVVRCCWEHSATRRAELAAAGRAGEWTPLGLTDLHAELSRVVTERYHRPLTPERLAEGQALWESLLSLSERLAGDALAGLALRHDDHDRGQER